MFQNVNISKINDEGNRFEKPQDYLDIEDEYKFSPPRPLSTTLRIHRRQFGEATSRTSRTGHLNLQEPPRLKFDDDEEDLEVESNTQRESYHQYKIFRCSPEPQSQYQNEAAGCSSPLKLISRRRLRELKSKSPDIFKQRPPIMR